MIYFFLLLLSFFLTFVIKKYAISKSLVAQVNERSSHTVPTPHGGGIAIALTWFIGLMYLYFSNHIDSQFFLALLVGFIISIVSFFDDLYELSAKLRLVFQAIVSLGGLLAIGGLNVIDFGLFTIENQLITNTFAFFLIIWFINLYNFLDGINGYAGSEAVFLSISGFLIFSGDHFVILAVSVLGFLFWNYNKAKIFMGDVGSTLLGYTVAIFTLYYSNNSAENLWIWIILFSLYWFDATITLIRRKLNHEKLSQAHRKHAYQRLTQAGWSHFKVTNYAVLVNIVLFSIVYFITNIVIAFLISLIIMFCIMEFVDKKKAFYNV